MSNFQNEGKTLLHGVIKPQTWDISGIPVSYILETDFGDIRLYSKEIKNRMRKFIDKEVTIKGFLTKGYDHEKIFYIDKILDSSKKTRRKKTLKEEAMEEEYRLSLGKSYLDLLQIA